VRGVTGGALALQGTTGTVTPTVMRPSSPLHAAACIVLAALSVVTTVGAQELPPGFTDAQPVGAEPVGTTAATAAPAVAGTAAVTERYFGREAYAAVRAAVADTSRTCPITNDGLAALALAPVFKESSAATTPTTAPAPMTLSRYDEWTGTVSTTNNRDANYGLYAFRNPLTPYPRAFWHPGIGIWQYDSAGLGAPLTTIEAMDAGVVAADVARIMAAGYCNPSSTVVGHGPPYSDQERRYSAWRDWGYPCTLCEGFFQEMVGTAPKFANLNLVSGITPLGGTATRTCTLAGVTGTRPCWYVDPRVGVIQGATAWATLSPLDGGNPTVAPTPLSLPFYVVDLGTTEQRHWLRADTGYSIDIRAERTIGKNARPRSNQTGSGLTWSNTSGLCDVNTARGFCTPVPPPGVSSAALNVSSGYRPVALDADGDGVGDVLWYRPGPGSDALWRGKGSGSFGSTPLTINGTYDDVLAGDIDGDGDDDVLWYARASGAAHLWRSNGDGTFTSTALTPGAGRRPLLLDVDGDGADEVFWYGPGALSDSLWSWSGSTFSKAPRSVAGFYHPFTGDFDGNGLEDIFWYAPGPAHDYLWLHSVTGSTVSVARPVNGTYTPIVGDLDGDDRDDVLWYAPGAAVDTVWFGAPSAAFVSRHVTVNGTYTPIVADLTGTGRDSIIWYAPGRPSDSQWTWSASRSLSSRGLVLPGAHRPLVGAFSTGGADGVLWYEPTLPTDAIWYR
jgi:hypothetical protein